MIGANNSPWPKSGDDVCQLLHISSSSNLKCHGLTKPPSRNCTRGISAATSKEIKTLLGEVATSGDWDAAYNQLEKLSGLVLCKKDHQGQCTTLLSRWEKFLRVEEQYETDKTAVKKEENLESDVLREKCEPVHIKTEEEEEPKVQPTPRPPPIVKDEPTDDPTQSKANKSHQSHQFEQFGKELSIIEINKKIKKKILSPLSASEMKNMREGGAVYIYTFPETYRQASPHLKLGHSKEVDRRLKSWNGQCGYEPKRLCSFSSHLYRRVERLVHLQLGNCRKVEKGGCPGCGKAHNEWFATKMKIASATIGFWSDWTRLEPYDKAGHLKKEWAQKLQKIDLGDAECWDKFVNEDE